MIPHTEYEKLMLLEEIQRGDKVVIPHDIDHAHQMLHVAMCYINQYQQDVLDALSKDYA